MTGLIKTKEVAFEGYRVVVSPANYRTDGIHALMIQRAEAETPVDADGSDIVFALDWSTRVLLHPALVCGTVEHDGFDHWPLTWEEVGALPGAFVREWEEAVYSLNPDWRPQIPPSEAEKKAGGSEDLPQSDGQISA